MVYSIKTTNEYDKWFTKLKDAPSKSNPGQARPGENGNFGDHEQLGEELFELRMFFWSRLQNLLYH